MKSGLIFPHFGHTSQFKIYEVEDGKIARQPGRGRRRPGPRRAGRAAAQPAGGHADLRRHWRGGADRPGRSGHPAVWRGVRPGRRPQCRRCWPERWPMTPMCTVTTTTTPRATTAPTTAPGTPAAAAVRNKEATPAAIHHAQRPPCQTGLAAGASRGPGGLPKKTLPAPVGAGSISSREPCGGVRFCGRGHAPPLQTVTNARPNGMTAAPRYCNLCRGRCLHRPGNFAAAQGSAGGISGLRAAAARRLASETRLRAQ